MRSAITLIAALAALTTIAPAASADARPLPEIPPLQCGFAGCPDPAEGVKECVTNGVAALVDALEGTPQPRTCDPLGRTRTAARPPEPHCDPMACPDPVAMAEQCLRTASLTTDPNTGLPVVTCSLR